MKRSFLFFCILALLSAGAALAHDHIDSGEGYVVYSGYVAPTEDQDGSTGEGTCSVCGAVVEPASRIPKLKSQREVNNPPDPTPRPEKKPESPPTAPPAAREEKKPESPPAAREEKKSESGSSPQGGEGGSAPKQSRESRPAAADPTPVPAPVRPSGRSGAGPTAQPQLQDYATGPASPSSPGGGSGGNAFPGGRSSGAGKKSSSGAVRDLKRYPVFSARFPWRRLRMEPAAGIEVHLAGRLVWPLPDAESPLMVLLQK